jgi:pimeloyl-ACP methyl ester carboxylesterase/DNA-binding CsgD family transcriptional regulator
MVWIGHWVRHLNFDWDNPVWRPWLVFLTERHTVYRYDWRGCGLSDRENIEFSLDKHVEDLESVVDAAGLRRFILFACAGGATMSIAFSAKHPDMVSHLILYGSQTRGAIARGVHPSNAFETHVPIRIVELGWHDERPAYGKFFTTLHMPDANDEQIRRHDELLRLTTSPENTARLLRAFFEADVSDVITQVRCPTLVLHARKDAIMPFDEGRLVASLIPGARFVPLESRNHLLLETESAWKEFVEAIDAFLPRVAADQRDNAPLSSAPDDLTPREHQVLELLARGIDNATIAAKLRISEKTVRNHVSIIFSKLGVNSRAQAVARARDAGFGRAAAV